MRIQLARDVDVETVDVGTVDVETVYARVRMPVSDAPMVTG